MYKSQDQPNYEKESVNYSPEITVIFSQMDLMTTESKGNSQLPPPPHNAALLRSGEAEACS